MRLSIAFLLAAVAACAAPKKQDPDAPRPDDVPQVLTCCIVTQTDGNPRYNTVPEASCAEENRNPVDACNVGPGDLPREQ